MKNKSSPGSEKLFLIISAVLAGLSILFFILAVFFPGNLSKMGLTGFATAGNTTAGKINLSIEEGLIINFTTDLIEWGQGSVDTGSLNATLDTSRNSAETKVLNGNWSMTNGSTNFNKTNGLVLQNIGNVNATLYIKTASNAAGFLGGTSPAYQYNVTNNETGSCGQNLTTTGNSTNATYFGLGLYYNVNATAGDGTRICDWFNFEDEKDALTIHMLLRVPSDSLTGTLEDTVTATAFAS